MTKENKEVGYGAAIKEIETILAKMNDTALDVDALSGYVERATELIALCREKLLSARAKLPENK